MFANNRLAKWLASLLAVLILASLVRFWDLNKIPNGLHWDEMDTGYQAYSLFKTGRDYYGNILPLFPHSQADYRTPVFIYANVPIAAILDLNAFSVRVWSVILGVISVFLIFVL